MIFQIKSQAILAQAPPARSLVIGVHGTRHTHALRCGGGGGDGRGPRTWLQLGGEVALAKPPPSSEAAPVAAPCTRADAPPLPAGPPRRSLPRRGPGAPAVPPPAVQTFENQLGVRAAPCCTRLPYWILLLATCSYCRYTMIYL